MGMPKDSIRKAVAAAIVLAMERARDRCRANAEPIRSLGRSVGFDWEWSFLYRKKTVSAYDHIRATPHPRSRHRRR